MLDGFQLLRHNDEEGWYGEGLDGASVDSLRAGAQDIPDFAANKTAFYFGPLEFMSWVEDENPELDYLVQGIPVQDGTVVLASVVSRLCVNADSKYLKEAQDFVTFMTEHIYQELVQDREALLPVYEEVDFVLGNERMRRAYEAFIAGRQFPAEDMRLYFTYWDTVMELCISMFDGMSPEEAAEEYNRIQKEQTAKYGARRDKV